MALGPSEELVSLDNVCFLFTYNFLRKLPLSGTSNPFSIEPVDFNLRFERLVPYSQRTSRGAKSVDLEYKSGFELVEKSENESFLEPPIYTSIDGLLRSSISQVNISVPELNRDLQTYSKASIPGSYAHFQENALRELGLHDFRWSGGRIVLRYMQNNRASDDSIFPIGVFSLNSGRFESDLRGALEFTAIHNWVEGLVSKYRDIAKK